MAGYNASKILGLIKEYREDNRENIDAIQADMFEIDLRYHRADSDWMKACEEYKDKGSKGSMPENVQPPILLEQTEAMVAYLSSIFLKSTPIYSPKLPPQMETEETEIEALMVKYQNENMWVAEELQALRNIVKHNLSASLISWKDHHLAAGVGINFSGDYEGLTNSTLSLYDCIWDTDTAPKDFNSEGMYFEYQQFKSKHKALKMVSLLEEGDMMLKKKQVVKLLEGDKSDYLRIKTIKSMKATEAPKGGSTNYLGFFDSDSNEARGELAPKFKYEGFRISTIYVRATSKDLGKTSDSLRYNIYKILMIDDTVIQCKLLDLPMFEIVLSVGIVDDFGYDTKSIVEPVVMYQDVASKLVRAKLAAVRRAAFDRAIYNPLYLKSADVNNTSDALKMPIRRSQWFDPNAVRNAYDSVPFQDNTSRDLLNDASMYMNDFPNRATGISEFRRSPVRGNKSKGQFELESQAADGRGYSLALTLEASRYTSIRRLMQVHLLVNTPVRDGLDWSKVDRVLDFSISDGLTSLGMFDSLANLESFMVLAAQNEQFAPLVNNIMKHVLSAKTPFKIQDFELQPKQQPQQPQQQGVPYEGNRANNSTES